MSHATISAAGLAELFTSPAISRDILKRAVRVERAAKRLCPVDTGRLRSSITAKLAAENGLPIAVVGTDVEYALFQEWGTRYQRGTPFLRPALSAAAGPTDAERAATSAARQRSALLREHARLVAENGVDG